MSEQNELPFNDRCGRCHGVGTVCVEDVHNKFWSRKRRLISIACPDCGGRQLPRRLSAPEDKRSAGFMRRG